MWGKQKQKDLEDSRRLFQISKMVLLCNIYFWGRTSRIESTWIPVRIAKINLLSSFFTRTIDCAFA